MIPCFEVERHRATAFFYLTRMPSEIGVKDIIASAEVSLFGGDRRLWAFQVYRPYRGIGLGSWFLDRIMEDDDYPTWLGAQPFNSPSMSLEQTVFFYEKRGWRKTKLSSNGTVQEMEYHKGWYER